MIKHFIHFGSLNLEIVYKGTLTLRVIGATRSDEYNHIIYFRCWFGGQPMTDEELKDLDILKLWVEKWVITACDK